MAVNKKKIAESNFKADSTLKRQYIFDDGYCFARKVRAEEHKAFSGKDYEIFTRDEKKADAGSGEPTEADIIAVKEELKGFELNAESDWETIQRIGKTLGVEAKSKADYVAALEPIKAALS